MSKPDRVFEVLQSLEWHKAMTAKYLALMKNATWTLVHFSLEMNLILTKWIFRVKYTKYGGC